MLFTATGPVETMRVVAQPGANGVLVGEPVNLSIQLIGSDGATVYPNKYVYVAVTSGSFGFSGCSLGTCRYQTDSTGTLALTGAALAAGSISIKFNDDLTQQTITFNASSKPDVMRLIGAPASGGDAGTQAATPFAVQVLFADGITAAPGRSIALSVTSGSAGFDACGGTSTCIVQTDASGRVSALVTPLSGGSITLSAAEGSVTQTATFTARAVPEVMQIVSVPANGSLVGNLAAAPFSVRVLAGDGATPLPGHSVTLAVTNGSARLAACSGSSCVVVSDANGLASTGVTPLAAGVVSLAASDGAVIRSTSFNAGASVAQHSLTLLPSSVHVAEGATLRINLVASAIENGSPSAAQPVSWTASQGASLSSPASATASDGTSALPVVLGPLAAGAGATATACAWGNVCASFTGTAVSLGSLQVAVTAGAQQAVTGGAALAPVQATVTDGAGNVVAGVSVTLFQTVTALDANCPNRGRCPAAPVLLSQTTVVVTDSNGNVTLTPLTVAGVATQTEIAFSAGTQGFVTTVLTRTP